MYNKERPLARVSIILCNFAAVKIKEVLSALERFAPLPLQESWDNAGLQLGLTETEVSGALLCLDVNERIVDEAMAKGCNLIVSHHPLLFRGLKTISDLTDVQRTVMRAIKQGIAVVSMHTNMDNARGGVNFKIAQKLGLQNVAFFAQKQVDGIEAGSGVVGELPEAMAADDFIIGVKNAFGVGVEFYSKYGFILRYPAGKEEITSIEFEPWHFRYVGVDAASVMAQNGMCLEEFWSNYVE